MENNQKPIEAIDGTIREWVGRLGPDDELFRATVTVREFVNGQPRNMTYHGQGRSGDAALSSARQAARERGPAQMEF